MALIHAARQTGRSVSFAAAAETAKAPALVAARHSAAIPTAAFSTHDSGAGSSGFDTKGVLMRGLTWTLGQIGKGKGVDLTRLNWKDLSKDTGLADTLEKLQSGVSSKLTWRQAAREAEALLKRTQMKRNKNSGIASKSQELEAASEAANSFQAARRPVAVAVEGRDGKLFSKGSLAIKEMLTSMGAAENHAALQEELDQSAKRAAVRAAKSTELNRTEDMEAAVVHATTEMVRLQEDTLLDAQRAREDARTEQKRMANDLKRIHRQKKGGVVMTASMLALRGSAMVVRKAADAAQYVGREWDDGKKEVQRMKQDQKRQQQVFDPPAKRMEKSATLP